MPIIVVKVTEYSNMERDLRTYFKQAEIPEYSYKETRSGFEVWHAREREGEVKVLWRSFGPDDSLAKDQIEGLRKCAAVLMLNKFWVRIETPSNYTTVNQPTLRVVYRLEWLK